MKSDTSVHIPQKDLFRPDEVAEYFGVTPETIYNWASEGRLDSLKIGGVRRITRLSIITLLSKSEET